MKNYRSIDEYISNFPQSIQEILQKLRKTIRKAAPGATEAISYGIPTFKLNGKNLVHFGGFKDHVSFFPTSSGVSAFKKELSQFQLSKGTIKFPFDKPIPFTLISRVVKFRIREVTK